MSNPDAIPLMSKDKLTLVSSVTHPSGQFLWPKGVFTNYMILEGRPQDSYGRSSCRGEGWNGPFVCKINTPMKITTYKSESAFQKALEQKYINNS